MEIYPCPLCGTKPTEIGKVVVCSCCSFSTQATAWNKKAEYAELLRRQVGIVSPVKRESTEVEHD